MSRAPKGQPAELPSDGEYKATVVYVYDIGTQIPRDPKKKPAHQVDVGFELHGVKKEDGSPFLVRQRYTYSSDERSNLSKDCKRAWKIRDMEVFDLVNLRGKQCVFDIEASTDGKYANIVKESIMPPKGTYPKPVTKFQSLFLDETFDQDVYDSLWTKMKETIAKSPEYDDVKAAERKPSRKSRPAAKKPNKPARRR